MEYFLCFALNLHFASAKEEVFLLAIFNSNATGIKNAARKELNLSFAHHARSSDIINRLRRTLQSFLLLSLPFFQPLVFLYSYFHLQNQLTAMHCGSCLPRF
ncbi:hypothetical protein J437_LFUL010009 [Ladona fulva]|uniref:Uncharacterized protein n=1 Tax=Ladona fulva TaxID=123851 RepID=A0A8K0K8G6_LADFU|nr:hypothetical protein J437_LFUL010009 [Ladona fulva]